MIARHHLEQSDERRVWIPGAGGELLTVTITGRWRPSDKRKEPWHRDWRQREPMRPTF